MLDRNCQLIENWRYISIWLWFLLVFSLPFNLCWRLCWHFHVFQALVDGPVTHVPRTAVRLNQLRLTKFRVKFPYKASTSVVRKVWKDGKIMEKWKDSQWAKNSADKRKVGFFKKTNRSIGSSHQRNENLPPIVHRKSSHLVGTFLLIFQIQFTILPMFSCKKKLNDEPSSIGIAGWSITEARWAVWSYAHLKCILMSWGSVN